MAGIPFGSTNDAFVLSSRRMIAAHPIPPNRLISYWRKMTADAAFRLSRYFGMSADFWMNLPNPYVPDLVLHQPAKRHTVDSEAQRGGGASFSGVTYAAGLYFYPRPL
jgi:hypothetical protein